MRALAACLDDVDLFSRVIIGRPLRQYQLEPAYAILDSVLKGHGLTFAVMMSRQAGKNELSGQLEAYLLNLFQRRGGQIVKASPTYKPQTVNSLLRLTDRLDNAWTRGKWRRREGYIVELGQARALFFSAAPTANVVGATADILLEGDEAQSIQPAKWVKDFLPMGASTNVTRVLWGTAWNSDTLLATTIQQLRRQQRKDGRQRVFCCDAERVGQEVPAYGTFVQQEVERLGRQHPLVKTQYFLEEIDADGGLFPPARRALMRGFHRRRHEPEASRRYALLVDVGGEDEAPSQGNETKRTPGLLANSRRDATALTVVEMGWPGGVRDQPSYRIVDRKSWLGVRHTTLHERILELARHWRATWVVVDATGVGAGLASFLGAALGERVVPLRFSLKVKSEMGWDFLGLVETGRYSEYADDGESDTRQFWYEVQACQYLVRDGPGKLMSWGVWEAPGYDGVIAYGHDDLLVSAAMCVVLDGRQWPRTGESAIVQRRDVLDEVDAEDW